MSKTPSLLSRTPATLSFSTDSKAIENPKLQHNEAANSTRRQSAPHSFPVRIRPDGASSSSVMAPSANADARAPYPRPQIRPAIFDKYKPVKWIGKGQSGTVFAVETRMGYEDPHVVAGKQRPGSAGLCACKVIDIAETKKREDNKELLEDFLKEIDALKGSKQPNVQNLIDYSVEADKVYIVSSLCRGGDLAQALELRGCLCEEDAKTVMSGILRGVSYLHSKGIMHRDIKLENILLANCSHDMSKVKIIDTGFAKTMSGRPEAIPSESLNTVCGTPLYFAPEIVKPTLRAGVLKNKARYGTKADTWACGVVLYCLLSGCPPFKSMDVLELFTLIGTAQYDFHDPVWQLVSDEAIDMIKGLLEADPSKRLSAEEALQHPWMTRW